MSKKTLFPIAVGLLVSFLLPAQEKIKEVVTSDYNRNSVSFVVTQRGDSYDSYVKSALQNFNPGGKFDINAIPTKDLRAVKTRASSSSNSYQYQLSQDDVNALVGSIPFGRQILAYTFNRDGNGMMDDKLVRYRGNYDAKDQDVINARASMVGTEALGDAGHGLVSRSYVIVADPYRIERVTSKEGNVSYSTSTKAYAYKLGMSEDDLYDFYDKCWIYDDDSAAAKAEKRRAFEQFEAALVPVATVSSAGSGENPEIAVRSSLYSLIPELENAIPDWNVAVTISAVKPLRAKIGTKEGISNGSRFRAYSYKEDNNGNIVSVKRGFLRATEVSENNSISTGATEPSKFYQISGLANIDEGWTIKQSNDLGLGVALGAKVAFAGRAAFAVDADWLLNVNTNGTMSYLLLGLAIEGGKSNYLPMSAGLGYGYALHLSRIVEFMPYALVGADMLISSHSTTDSRDAWKEMAFLLEPGLRVAVNVAYPLQVYAKAYYDLIFLGGYRYNNYKAIMYGDEHYNRSSLAVQFGLKWTF